MGKPISRAATALVAVLLAPLVLVHASKEQVYGPQLAYDKDHVYEELWIPEEEAHVPFFDDHPNPVIQKLMDETIAKERAQKRAGGDKCIDIDGRIPKHIHYNDMTQFRTVNDAGCRPALELVNGGCQGHASIMSNRCHSFCQTSSFWFYGPPVDLMDGNICMDGEGCEFKQTNAFEVEVTNRETKTTSWTVNTSISGTLSVGFEKSEAKGAKGGGEAASGGKTSEAEVEVDPVASQAGGSAGGSAAGAPGRTTSSDTDSESEDEGTGTADAVRDKGKGTGPEGKGKSTEPEGKGKSTEPEGKGTSPEGKDKKSKWGRIKDKFKVEDKPTETQDKSTSPEAKDNKKSNWDKVKEKFKGGGKTTETQDKKSNWDRIRGKFGHGNKDKGKGVDLTPNKPQKHVHFEPDEPKGLEGEVPKPKGKGKGKGKRVELTLDLPPTGPDESPPESPDEPHHRYYWEDVRPEESPPESPNEAPRRPYRYSPENSVYWDDAGPSNLGYTPEEDDAWFQKQKAKYGGGSKATTQPDDDEQESGVGNKPTTQSDDDEQDDDEQAVSEMKRDVNGTGALHRRDGETTASAASALNNIPNFLKGWSVKPTAGVTAEVGFSYTSAWSHEYSHRVKNSSITSVKRRQPPKVGCGRFVSVPFFIAYCGWISEPRFPPESHNEIMAALRTQKDMKDMWAAEWSSDKSRSSWARDSRGCPWLRTHRPHCKPYPLTKESDQGRSIRHETVWQPYDCKTQMPITDHSKLPYQLADSIEWNEFSHTMVQKEAAFFRGRKGTPNGHS